MPAPMASTAVHDVGQAKIGIAQHVQAPDRCVRKLQKLPESQARRHGHAVAAIALAVSSYGGIHRETQGLATRRLAPLDQLTGQPPILEDVDLKHERPGIELPRCPRCSRCRRVESE